MQIMPWDLLNTATPLQYKCCRVSLSKSCCVSSICIQALMKPSLCWKFVESVREVYLDS
jgi:hypothetical protein